MPEVKLTKNLDEMHDKLTFKGFKQIEQGNGLAAKKIFNYLDSWGAKENLKNAEVII